MKEYIPLNLIDFTLLPDDIKVSTISATCHLGVNLKLNEIYKYIKLDMSKIVTIKYKNNIKSLLPQKKRKKKKNCFQNQMTVEIKPDLVDHPTSKVSLKIFKNGSIQMSGIKSIEAVNTVLDKLINELTKIYGIIEDKVIKEISFIEDNGTISISKFKIDMINSGFLIGFEVNRENLYNYLLKNKIECKYEPSIHAGVNVKFHPSNNGEATDKKVSIFIFESGNIIITGAKNIFNILEAYSFIKEFIESNKNNVQKSKIYNMLKNNIDNELRNMLKIDDDEDLMSLALNELDISEKSFNFDDDKNLMTVDNSI